MIIWRKIGLLLGFLSIAVFSQADERMYRCVFGLEGGCGYYIGDAQRHIFQDVREVYGANFRYIFTQRWALQVKGVTQRLSGTKPDQRGVPTPAYGKWNNQLINLDVSAEYNFFRFDESSYDKRVRTYTPYIGLGLGTSIHSGFKQVAVYMPFIVGFKWKFAPRFDLQLAWQHNLYFADNMENIPEYNNTYKLNGSNLFNCDLSGMLTIGLAFEFARDKKVCKMCKWN